MVGGSEGERGDEGKWRAEKESVCERERERIELGDGPAKTGGREGGIKGDYLYKTFHEKYFLCF